MSSDVGIDPVPPENAEAKTSADARVARGLEFEGYAFTFCKAAFLALVLQRYTLVGTSLAAAVLYVLAARAGVREWRCFVKPPWVVVAFGAIAMLEVRRLSKRRGDPGER